VRALHPARGFVRFGCLGGGSVNDAAAACAGGGSAKRYAVWALRQVASSAAAAATASRDACVSIRLSSRERSARPMSVSSSGVSSTLLAKAGALARAMRSLAMRSCELEESSSK